MTVELPKDAEGREIPLDTKVLYDEDGKEFKVDYFTYSARQSIPNLEWGVVFMNCRYDYCHKYYLALPDQPDSLEKLEEDLGKILNHLEKIVCAYFNRERKDCDGCKLENYEGSCSHACLEDIMTRIHELRGEN